MYCDCCVLSIPFLYLSEIHRLCGDRTFEEHHPPSVLVNKNKIDLEDIEIVQISDSHKPLLQEFRSYEQELVRYLIENALQDQVMKMSITYLWFLKPTKELIGYISVLADAINLEGTLKKFFRNKGVTYTSMPALKIGRLCVADSYRGRGIGRLMIQSVICLSENIGKEIGLRYITVDAKRNADPTKDSLHFYSKMQFTIFKLRDTRTVPMYKDLVISET
jgi:GNAT superfamily N-acetyltransferase